MKNEEKAVSAVSALVKERDDAQSDSRRFQHQVSRLNGEVASLTRKNRELEERLYRNGVHALNSMFEVEMRTNCWLPARMLTLHIVPKMQSVAITAETFRFANDPMHAVSEHIEQLVKHHSEHVRQELRECAWKAAEYARRSR
jgi:hypothetical protein